LSDAVEAYPFTWQDGYAGFSCRAPQDMNLPDHVGEIYHGHAGVVRTAERWTEPFEWLVVELEEIVDAGDHLFSFHRWRAKARHTGIEINERLAYRWTFRDGKVIHFRSRRSRRSQRWSERLSRRWL